MKTKQYTQPLQKRVDRFALRWVSGVSRFTRTVMRSSIVKAKKQKKRKRNKKTGRLLKRDPNEVKVQQTSLPGQPPLGHKGEFLRRGIVYAVDKNKKSGVIGVLKRSRSTAAKALDKGGKTKMRITRGKKRGKTVSFRIKARPFTKRALFMGIKNWNAKQLEGKL